MPRGECRHVAEVLKGEAEMVNLDTGTAVALVSEGSPVRHHLKAQIGQSGMIMTQTAVVEFQQIIAAVGGPLEQARAARLLQRVQTDWQQEE